MDAVVSDANVKIDLKAVDCLNEALARAYENILWRALGHGINNRMGLWHSAGEPPAEWLCRVANLLPNKQHNYAMIKAMIPKLVQELVERAAKGEKVL
jgi:hypothetical protein